MSARVNLSNALVSMREGFNRKPYPAAEERILWLDKLKEMVLSHQKEIEEAISADFGHRSADETRLAEVLPTLNLIHYHRKRLRRWMKPESRFGGLLFIPGKTKTLYQPIGIVGIITPWSYPLLLALGPVVTAFSAGNRCMIKMSEYTPNFGALLAKICQQYFGSELIQIINGDVNTGREFSQLPFDHLLFTGSTSVGRHIMSAAAENLTPVTLELGGKCPVLISRSISIREAARRLVWPKALNSGQTCTAPDYILCPEERLDSFIDAFRDQYLQRYPTFEDNPDVTSIINATQHQRLTDAIKQAEELGAKVIPLHETTQGSQKLPFTIVINVNDDMSIMQQEIFGPILPVLTYKTMNEAYEYTSSKPHPLAFYFFGFDRREWQHVIYKTHSGGLVINDTTVHVGINSLPFGGVGQSGMGVYHGKEGFISMSNAKGIHIKGRISLTAFAGAPYKGLIPQLIQKIFIR